MGAKSFTMAAADKANSGSAAVTYQVSYGVCLLFDTARSLKTGSTIPVKLQVGDAGGANTSSSAVLVTAQRISLVSTSVSEPLQDRERQSGQQLLLRRQPGHHRG